MIAAGRVAVNGQTVTEQGRQVGANDVVTVDGRRVEPVGHVYILLNKPRGYVTTTKDERGRKTVLDLLSGVGERVYPVGRLDYNTEGLLLLTNDGELTNQLIHPKFAINKTYAAQVEGIPTEEELDALRTGVELNDGRTSPAFVSLQNVDRAADRAELLVTIHEGRNRQVRRMCEAIGYPVLALKRLEFAFLTLLGLKRGQYRSLTADEVAALKALSQGSDGR